MNDMELGLLVIVLHSILISFLWRSQRSSEARLPPGPFSYPVVGALFSLTEPLHQHFAKINKKYGPIIYLKIGMASFVVANNSEMAATVLKVHDLEFSNRPDEEMMRIVGHHNNDLIWASVGERRWKKMRRICSIHLFSNDMLNSSAGFRELEMTLVLKSIFQQPGKEINLRTIFKQVFANSMCLLLFSERDLELVDLVCTVSALSLNLNIGALVPALDRFDLHGIYKKMNKEIMPRVKKKLESQFAKHQLEKEQAGDSFVARDFIDVLISLEEELSDASKVALVSDMVFAGLETATLAIEWIMAEVIKHPEVMIKAQDEIDKAVGRDRVVQESDLPHLPYIEAIVKESLRLHPPAPLGAPHLNLKPVNLHGYTIPAKCKVLVNIWAIGRDPAHWADPEQFRPERFLESNFPANGQHFSFIPFSSGRRVCAGYPLAMRSMSYFLAALIQPFRWTCRKEGINMEESTRSFTMPMVSDLIGIASPRLDEKILS